MTGEAPAGRSGERGRVLGVDLGSRRIGVAVSDSARTVASPRTTLERSGDTDRDRRRLAALAVEEGAAVVVVGLPLSLDGARRRAARAAEAEAEALAGLLAPEGVAVETFDERLTTVAAQRALVAAGVAGRRRRKVVDRSAAAVMLQAWLDARRGGAGAAEG